MEENLENEVSFACKEPHLNLAAHWAAPNIIFLHLLKSAEKNLTFFDGG